MLFRSAGKNAYRLEESDVLLCNRIAENTGLEAGGEMLLYEDARHEVLHEINRSDVFEDIYEWLQKQI